jgi:hypothetical protein
MSTISLYNHTASRFVLGLNGVGDTYKVMLLSSSASFNATHTKLTEVSNAAAYEVYGNGWTQGGVTLTGVTLALATTNDAAFDANDVAQAISGGSLGPYSAYVIYNDTDTDDPPVAYVALTAPQTIADGNTAGITWDADGIVKFTVT